VTRLSGRDGVVHDGTTTLGSGNLHVRRERGRRRGGWVWQGDDGHGDFGQGLTRAVRWRCDKDGEGTLASDRTGALRRRSDRACPGSGPWRSERQFYACACGDGRTPSHSANRGTTRGGLAADRWAPCVSDFSNSIL
jgi:hypothetical protein